MNSSPLSLNLPVPCSRVRIPCGLARFGFIKLPLLVFGLAALAFNGVHAFAAPGTAATQPVEKDFVKDTGFTYGAWRTSIVGGGGYIQNVVPCPTNAKRFYAYVDVGGFYRSDDGGQNWRMLHGNLPASLGNLQIRGLLVDPRDDKKITLASGSQYGKKEGIYLSSDAGVTWKKTLDAKFNGNEGPRSAGFVLARDPQKPDHLVTATLKEGVFRSDDNGETWKNVLTQEVETPTDIRFDRTESNRLWLCVAGSGSTCKPGFFRSEDGGAKWDKIADKGPSEIVQDPLIAKTLYGIFGSQIIRRSIDQGTTWEDFSDGLEIKIEEKKPSVGTSTYRALGVGPDFILTANTSNSTFFRLKSGASKWERIEKEKVEGGDWYHMGGWFFGGALGSITVDPHDANHWFLTDYFATYQTMNAGKTWRLTINGMEATVSHCLLQDPSNPNVVQLGQADVGPFRSTDGGKRFHRDQITNEGKARDGAGNMKCIDLSPKLPTRLYGTGNNTCYDGWRINQVFISSDSGAGWHRSPMTGLPDLKGKGATTITADLNDANTVYVTVAGKVGPGNGGVYKSTDGGTTWASMSTGLADGQYYFPFDCWAHGRQLAASSDGSLIAISKQGGLCYRFDPATQAWSRTSLRKGPNVLWSVVADRLKPGRYFVGAANDGIYRTDDSGQNWKQVCKRGASYVVTDAVVAGRVAAGTAAEGVLLSTDSGDTWQDLDKGLPARVNNIPCFVGERLLVGSDGSGVFWIPLSPKGEKDVAAK